MNLGLMAALTAAAIGVVTIGTAVYTARRTVRARESHARVAFAVTPDVVADMEGKKVSPRFLTTETLYHTDSVAAGYLVHSIVVVDEAGVGSTNSYVDEAAFENDLRLLTRVHAVPSLDLHLVVEAEPKKTLYTLFGQAWSRLLLGEGERLAEPVRAFVTAAIRANAPTDFGRRLSATEVTAFLDGVEKAFGPEIEADETLRGQMRAARSLVGQAGEKPVIVATGDAVDDAVQRGGASHLRRTDDGLTAVTFT